MSWGQSTSVVGIDLEGATMRAVQVGHTAHGAQVHAAVEVARPDPHAPIGGEDVSLLMEVLERQDFQRHGLVVGMPASSLFSEVLELPPRDSGAPIETLAKMEVARIRHREPESFELASWDLPSAARAGEATHVLAIGCEHQHANALLDLLEAHGAGVRALDVRSCALARSLGSVTTSGVTGVVELSWDVTRLVVMLGDVVLYERCVEDAGLRVVREEIIRIMGVDDEVADFLIAGGGGEEGLTDDVGSILESVWDGAVDEINASLNYAEHRYVNADLRRLVLIGAGAHLPQATTMLRDAVSFEPGVVTMRDLADCEHVDDLVSSSPSMVAALGFAMWEA